jgi:hypothetical protein
MAAGSGGVDGTDVDGGPDRASNEKGSVGKNKVLGFGALSLFE